MITIVTGHRRSGTTMMMHCLQAAGQTNVLIAPGSLDEEPDDAMLEKLRYHPELIDNYLVKSMPVTSLFGLSAYSPGYEIIIMRRNPFEINASVLKRWGNPERLGEEHIIEMDRQEAILRQRIDFRVVSINYRDVINDPENGLKPLEIFGVNITQAATAVEPNKCHQKVEDLDHQGGWKPVTK
jgi:hypothetical protein